MNVAAALGAGALGPAIIDEGKRLVGNIGQKTVGKFRSGADKVVDKVVNPSTSTFGTTCPKSGPPGVTNIALA